MPATEAPENPWLNIPLAVNGDGELPIQNLMEFYIYENLDESYPDAGPSNPFINYNGSILQFIKDVSSKPFNEMYWTHNRGIATFNYRPTPFDPENWKSLTITEIPPSLITDVNIGTNDQEQAAVFKITPTNGEGQTEFDGGWAGNLAPLTNIALIRRYGYKLLQAQADYFNGQGAGSSSSDSDDDSDDKGQGNTDTQFGDSAIQHTRTAGTNGADSEAMKGYTAQTAGQNYPPYTSIVDAFYYTSGRKTGNSATVSVPKEAGGETGYQFVADALKYSNNVVDFKQRIAWLNLPDQDAGSLWTMRNGFNRTRYLEIVMPSYIPTNKAISKHSRFLKSYNAMKNNPEKAASELIDEMGYALGPEQAWQIVQAALAQGGKPSEAAYDSIINSVPFDQQHDGVSGGADANAVPFLFLQYTRKLFNWNADNAKFYSGTITVHGLPNYANAYIGERIMFYDDQNNVWWEFYCEGVKTSWDYQNGLQMTFDVTRGVPLETEYDSFDKRFTEPWSFWGKSSPFRGGYFGEQNLATAIANSSKDGGSGKGGGDLIDTAKDVMNNMNWTYSQGQRTDFRKNGHADCSSFVWYVCNKCGYDVGSTAFWTGTEPNYLDEISADETKSGSIVIANGDPHTAFLEEKWHGGDTQIINMGGRDNHGGPPGDVNEDTYAMAFGSANMSGMKFYKAKK